MKKKNKAGFTLIEVMATIVISAIALAALLPLMDRVFLLGHQPRVQLRQAFALQTTMEELVAWHTNGLDALQARVGVEEGTYDGCRVLHNRFIAFVGNAETAAVTSNNLLKITLQNTLGETLTRLFTEPL